MRYSVGFIWLLALAVVGCSETGDEGCVPWDGVCENAPCCEGLYCATFVGACEFHPDFGKSCESAENCSDKEPTPVCGCDGEVYEARCAALRAGVDIGGVCDDELTPAGLFPCGPRYCDAAHYCSFLFTNDTQPEEKNHYGCVTLPEACDGISEEEALCQCLEDYAWISRCYSVSGNGVTGIFVELVPI